MDISARFLGGSYQARSRNADAEKLIDLYPEIPDSGTEGKPALIGRPGLRALVNQTGFDVNSTLGPVRALFNQDGRTFSIAGNVFYELFSNDWSLAPFSASIRFQLAGTYLATTPDDPVATIASNGIAGHQLFIVTNGHGYTYDITTPAAALLVPITDPGFPTNARWGQFIDGYFVVMDVTKSAFQISALFDGTSWNGLDVAQRSMASDTLQSLLVSNRQIWLFGSATTEVWFNSGGTFPFSPIPGVFIQWGIAAPASAATLAGTVIWLAQNSNGSRMVMLAKGFDPQRVSTSAVEYHLQNYSTVADAYAWTYQEEGHHFYVLTFPTANATWVYDVSTQLWHERGWWNVTTGLYEAHRVRCHCVVDGHRHLVGDRLTNTWLMQELDRYTDDAVTVFPETAPGPIRAQRRLPGIDQELTRLPFARFQIDLENGVGVPNGLVGAVGTDPLLTLTWSNDGGFTWSNPYTMSAGPQGAYAQRVIWRRLGVARNRVFDVTQSDPVKRRWVGAFLNA